MGLIVKKVYQLKNVFLLGIFVSAFVFWPWAEVLYEIPKVWFVQRWIEIMAISALFHVKHLKKENIDNWSIILVLCFLIVVLASSVFGTDFAKSVSGNYYRADGLTTLFHMLLLFFTVTIYSNKSWIPGFARTVGTTGLILSVTSIGQWLVNLLGLARFETWDGGYGNFFGNPNFLAGYLIVTLPLTAYAFANFKMGIMFLLVQFAGILLTGTWVGYFGILIFLTIWFWLKFPKIKFLLLILSAALLLILGIKFVGYQKSLETPTSLNAQSRMRIAGKALLAFEKRPMLGYGWANFDKAFESVDYPIHINNDVYVDKAHASLLEILATTGMLGFTLYLLLIGRIGYNLYLNKPGPYNYLLWTFIFLIVHMQTNVISISEEMLFWIMAGFSVKLKRHE